MIPIELRRDLSVEDVDGRTLVGRALSYDRPYHVSDDGQNWYQEGWRSGALGDSIVASRNTFELRALHRDVRVGLVSFHDSAEALSFRAIVDESDEGEHLLHDVESSGLPGVSLGFRPRRQSPSGGVLWRLKAIVRELSVTDRAQYPDAAVLAVRSTPDTDPALAARFARLEETLARGRAWGVPSAR